MIRLRDAHQGQRALVVFGGPSLMALDFDFACLRGLPFVTFLETKALTPWFLRSGFVPDYFLMLFPEKAKDNTLQHFVYRSFLANRKIEWFLKPQYRQVAVGMREHFDEYFETWKPHRGRHKRYRWRPHVYLPDSPYDLLRHLPTSRVIVDRDLVNEYFPEFAYADRAFYFVKETGERAFDTDRYFSPIERDGDLYLRSCDLFQNSAAIALYPLLRYLGFREVYCLGMDMSVLGSFEYAAPFTFRSMAHYWWFLRRNGHVFGARYAPNGWLFARPRNEFDDVRNLWRDAPMKFTRVYEEWRYAPRIDGVPVIPIAQLLQARP